MRAFETMATVAAGNRLILDRPIAFPQDKKVRVVVLMPEEEDIDQGEWLRFAAVNPALNFLQEPVEDIYSDSDGEAYRG